MQQPARRCIRDRVSFLFARIVEASGVNVNMDSPIFIYSHYCIRSITEIQCLPLQTRIKFETIFQLTGHPSVISPPPSWTCCFPFFCVLPIFVIVFLMSGDNLPPTPVAHRMADHRHHCLSIFQHVPGSRPAFIAQDPSHPFPFP